MWLIYVDQTCLQRCSCVRQYHQHSRSCRHTGKHGERKLQYPEQWVDGMYFESLNEHLALELPILALHLPTINLIPTVAAVIVSVAPSTGVQTLPVRTSVGKKLNVKFKSGDFYLNRYSLSQWFSSGQSFSSDTSVQSGKPSQSRSLGKL